MALEPTDAQVVREVLAGRVERFDILVRRYQRLVATAALRMGVPGHEVEDITSGVFYKVFRSLNRYRQANAMSTWLYRITVNAALDWRRTSGHRSRMEEISPELKDGRPSPQERAIEEDRARLLRRALDRIPGHYRTPLVLVHVEGLALEEVARVLALPEGTVKSRLFRARALLRRIIERHYPALAPAGAPVEAE
ncbi:MAG: RNA polymerase sigma factor [Acidobacteriota bacterium]